MGRSRAKANRVSTPLPRFTFSSLLLSRSTILFVLGVFLLAYGSAAMQYSRWDHGFNRHVHPVFHVWAIVVGLLLIVVSYRWKD